MVQTFIERVIYKPQKFNVNGNYITEKAWKAGQTEFAIFIVHAGVATN